MSELSFLDHILSMTKAQALAALFLCPNYIASQFGVAIVADVNDGDYRYLVIDRRKMNHSRSDRPAKNLRFPFFIIRIDDGSQDLVLQCRSKAQAMAYARNPVTLALTTFIVAGGETTTTRSGYVYPVVPLGNTGAQWMGSGQVACSAD